MSSSLSGNYLNKASQIDIYLSLVKKLNTNISSYNF